MELFLNEILTLLVLLGLTEWCFCKKNILLTIDTHDPIQVVHPLSPSVALGIGDTFEYGWINYFNDSKFLTLARGLGPAFVRVGGTKADFVTFKPTRDDWVGLNRSRLDRLSCQPARRNESAFQTHKAWANKMSLRYAQNKRNNGVRNALKPIILTGSDWNKLNQFCECVGWNLIYGLSLIKRNGSHWNSSNAEELLEFTENKYKVNWELGNEPNSYTHKTGITLTPEQVGEGFVVLRSLLNRSPWWKSSQMFGPDLNRIYARSSDTFLGRYLAVADNVINGVTVHQYYMNGKNTSVDEYLNPVILNVIADEIQALKTELNESSSTQPLWFGETASAYGGGAPGLSNTYIDGFVWLDKLGMTSKLGVKMVVRQTFFGGHYALVDNDFNPMPDYWLTLIYKKLVGNKVLKVNLDKCSRYGCYPENMGRLRIYAHCANYERSPYMRGAVVLTFINLRKHSLRLFMKPFNDVILKTDMYLLQPSIPGNITSQGILLNDQILKLTDQQTIPNIRPKRLQPSETSKGIRIPGRTYGFVVFRNAAAIACL